MRNLFILLLFFTPIVTIAQNPIANFNVSTTACLNESILLTNTSVNANTFLWDICQGDLALPPSAKNLKTLSANIPLGIDVVFDGTEWFGFVANQNGNSILRIDFGTELLNDNPEVVNLGNFGNKISAPADIKIVEENNLWYGFVYGLSGSILSRIDFGSSLRNTVSNGVNVVSLKTGGGSTNAGLDVIKTSAGWRLLYTSGNNIYTVVLPTLGTTPSDSEFYPGIEISGTTLGDIVAIESNQNYFAYVVSFGNQTIHSISFGGDITNSASTQNLGVSFSGSLPYGLDAALDNGIYTLFVSTLQGNLFRINLGESPTVSPIATTNLTTFSTLENTLKITLAKSKSSWFAFTPSWSSSRLFRIDFPSPACTTETLSEVNPVLNYSTSGKRGISLIASNNGLNPSEKSITINIENKVAPVISWQNIGVCKNNTVSFQSSSPAAQNFEWRSNGITFSNQANPSILYSQTGTYYVELFVSDAQGCKNYLGKDVKIYDQPIATFEIPNQLICTNNQYTITAQTPDVFDGFLNYSWELNGVEISTQRDVNFFLNDTNDVYSPNPKVLFCKNKKCCF
jgi:hypothetical protein